MIIIPEALELAKLQRTSMTEEQIINSYEKDYQDINSAALGEQGLLTGKVLDIGCGIAGWEATLEYWENPEIYLLDKTEVDPNVFYGFKPKTSFYNSMEIAKKNLVENGIKEENIFLQEATEKNEILFDEEFDLITSFISCGFHYPVETYLDKIYDKLKKGGILIIDIRKESNGDEKIMQKFGKFKVIREEQKYWRIKAIK